MPEYYDDRSDILPDIPADAFHPPRWMVMTAGGVILLGGLASATIALVGVLDPGSGVAAASGVSAASVKGEIRQAVPMGAFVLNERAPAPAAAPRPKTDAEAETVAAVPVTAEPAAPPAAPPPPEKPVEAALKEIPF